jgi:hypothetical protein
VHISTVAREHHQVLKLFSSVLFFKEQLSEEVVTAAADN